MEAKGEVMCDGDLSRRMKKLVYQAAVLGVLLYGADMGKQGICNPETSLAIRNVCTVS